MKKYIETHIGYKFGLFSALFLGLEILIFNKIPFFRNLKNPFDMGTNFCSENVVRAYREVGIYLGGKNDAGTMSPIDILNSPGLEIVGYIDEGQSQGEK